MEILIRSRRLTLEERKRPVLEEQERLAYISGDVRTAKLLGELLDALQAGAVEQRQEDQAVLALAP